MGASVFYAGKLLELGDGRYRVKSVGGRLLLVPVASDGSEGEPRELGPYRGPEGVLAELLVERGLFKLLEGDAKQLAANTYAVGPVLIGDPGVIGGLHEALEEARGAADKARRVEAGEPAGGEREVEERRSKIEELVDTIIENMKIAARARGEECTCPGDHTLFTALMKLAYEAVTGRVSVEEAARAISGARYTVVGGGEEREIRVSVDAARGAARYLVEGGGRSLLEAVGEQVREAVKTKDWGSLIKAYTNAIRLATVITPGLLGVHGYWERLDRVLKGEEEAGDYMEIVKREADKIAASVRAAGREAVLTKKEQEEGEVD